MMLVRPVPQGDQPVNDAQNQFIAVCPECSTILKVSVNKLGQNVRCSQCRQTFIAGEAIVPSSQHPAVGPSLQLSQASDEVERIDAVCPGCNAKSARRDILISVVMCAASIATRSSRLKIPRKLRQRRPKLNPRPIQICSKPSTSGFTSPTICSRLIMNG